MSIFRKSIAWLILITFVWTNCAWSAEAGRANIFQKKQPAPAPKPKPGTAPAKPAVQKPAAAKAKTPEKPKIVRAGLTHPSQLKIPAEFGSVKERWPHDASQPVSKIIIHIQDAHCNYQAQMNMAKMLEYLWLAHGVSLILVEGGSRSDSLSYMREYAPKEKRKEVADKYLRMAKICGENYLDIVEDYPIDVFGIEKPQLYDANMNAFLKLDEIRDKDLALLDNLRQTADALKEKLYSKQLLDLEAKKRDYAGEKMKFKDYAVYLLERLDNKNALKKQTMENTALYAEALELERKADLKQAELERAKLLEHLTKTLPQEKIKACLAKTQEAKDNKIKQSEYYNYLKALLPQPSNIAKAYPNLSAYIDYLAVFDNIDNEELFKELPLLEDAAYKNLLGRNKDAAELYFISKSIDTLEGLIDIKITPDEAKFYTENKNRFKVKRWKEFLAKQAGRFGMATNIDPQSTVLDNHLAFIDDFYAVAKGREAAFLENSIKAMDTRLPISPLTEKAAAPDANPAAPKAAVLICGGYHTATLVESFRNNNIAYVVVAPNVTTPTDKILYRTVLKEVYTPMSKPEGPVSPSAKPVLSGLLRQQNDKDASNLRQKAVAENPESSKTIAMAIGANPEEANRVSALNILLSNARAAQELGMSVTILGAGGFRVDNVTITGINGRGVDFTGSNRKKRTITYDDAYFIGTPEDADVAAGAGAENQLSPPEDTADEFRRGQQAAIVMRVRELFQAAAGFVTTHPEAIAFLQRRGYEVSPATAPENIFRILDDIERKNPVDEHAFASAGGNESAAGKLDARRFDGLKREQLTANDIPELTQLLLSPQAWYRNTALNVCSQILFPKGTVQSDETDNLIKSALFEALGDISQEAGKRPDNTRKDAQAEVVVFLAEGWKKSPNLFTEDETRRLYTAVENLRRFGGLNPDLRDNLGNSIPDMLGLAAHGMKRRLAEKPSTASAAGTPTAEKKIEKIFGLAHNVAAALVQLDNAQDSPPGEYGDEGKQNEINRVGNIMFASLILFERALLQETNVTILQALKKKLQDESANASSPSPQMYYNTLFQAIDEQIVKLQPAEDAPAQAQAKSTASAAGQAMPAEEIFAGLSQFLETNAGNWLQDKQIEIVRLPKTKEDNVLLVSFTTKPQKGIVAAPYRYTYRIELTAEGTLEFQSEFSRMAQTITSVIRFGAGIVETEDNSGAEPIKYKYTCALSVNPLLQLVWDERDGKICAVVTDDFFNNYNNYIDGMRKAAKAINRSFSQPVFLPIDRMIPVHIAQGRPELKIMRRGSHIRIPAAESVRASASGDRKIRKDITSTASLSNGDKMKFVMRRIHGSTGGYLLNVAYKRGNASTTTRYAVDNLPPAGIADQVLSYHDLYRRISPKINAGFLAKNRNSVIEAIAKIKGIVDSTQDASVEVIASIATAEEPVPGSMGEWVKRMRALRADIEQAVGDARKPNPGYTCEIIGEIIDDFIGDYFSGLTVLVNLELGNNGEPVRLREDERTVLQNIAGIFNRHGFEFSYPNLRSLMNFISVERECRAVAPRMPLGAFSSELVLAEALDEWLGKVGKTKETREQAANNIPEFPVPDRGIDVNMRGAAVKKRLFDFITDMRKVMTGSKLLINVTKRTFTGVLGDYLKNLPDVIAGEKPGAFWMADWGYNPYSSQRISELLRDVRAAESSQSYREKIEDKKAETAAWAQQLSETMKRARTIKEYLEAETEYTEYQIMVGYLTTYLENLGRSVQASSDKSRASAAGDLAEVERAIKELEETLAQTQRRLDGILRELSIAQMADPKNEGRINELVAQESLLAAEVASLQTALRNLKTWPEELPSRAANFANLSPEPATARAIGRDSAIELSKSAEARDRLQIMSFGLKEGTEQISYNEMQRMDASHPENFKNMFTQMEAVLEASGENVRTLSPAQIIHSFTQFAAKRVREAMAPLARAYELDPQVEVAIEWGSRRPAHFHQNTYWQHKIILNLNLLIDETILQGEIYHEILHPLAGSWVKYLHIERPEFFEAVGLPVRGRASPVESGYIANVWDWAFRKDAAAIFEEIMKTALKCPDTVMLTASKEMYLFLKTRLENCREELKELGEEGTGLSYNIARFLSEHPVDSPDNTPDNISKAMDFWREAIDLMQGSSVFLTRQKAKNYSRELKNYLDRIISTEMPSSTNQNMRDKADESANILEARALMDALTEVFIVTKELEFLDGHNKQSVLQTLRDGSNLLDKDGRFAALLELAQDTRVEAVIRRVANTALYSAKPELARGASLLLNIWQRSPEIILNIFRDFDSKLSEMKPRELTPPADLDALYREMARHEVKLLEVWFTDSKDRLKGQRKCVIMPFNEHTMALLSQGISFDGSSIHSSIDGQAFGKIYQSDFIARIIPESLQICKSNGAVIARLDAMAMLPVENTPHKIRGALHTYTAMRPMPRVSKTQDRNAAAREAIKIINRRGLNSVKLLIPDWQEEQTLIEIHPAELQEAFGKGIAIPEQQAQFLPTTGSKNGFRAAPDPHSLRLVRYADGSIEALMAVTIMDADNEPFEGDFRNKLRGLEQKSIEEKRFVPVIAPEPEMFLLRELQDGGLVTADIDGYYDDLRRLPSDVQAALREILIATESAGLGVRYIHHEVASGQFEIPYGHGSALEAADNTVFYKYIVKKVARKHRLQASFMPKPIKGVNGSGMHIHQSLSDVNTGENLFYDERDAKFGLSETARHYIAGLLKYAPAILRLTNPDPNSYLRIIPGYEAPVALVWGEKNRSGLVRVPAFSNPQGARIELRVPDPCGSIYTKFYAVISAGLRGIEERIEPPAPLEEESVFNLSAEERERRGIKELPGGPGGLQKAIESMNSPDMAEFIDNLLGPPGSGVREFLSQPQGVTSAQAIGGIDVDARQVILRQLPDLANRALVTRLGDATTEYEMTILKSRIQNNPFEVVRFLAVALSEGRATPERIAAVKKLLLYAHNYANSKWKTHVAKHGVVIGPLIAGLRSVKQKGRTIEHIRALLLEIALVSDLQQRRKIELYLYRAASNDKEPEVREAAARLLDEIRRITANAVGVSKEEKERAIAAFNAFDTGFTATADNCTVTRDLSGRINITYLLTDNSRPENKPYVVQYTHFVFNPAAVARNLELLQNAQEAAESQGAFAENGILENWTRINYFNTKDAGENILLVKDAEGRPRGWRVMKFVEGRIYQKLNDVPAQYQRKAVELAGQAIAKFGILTGFIPSSETLAQPLPNFHNHPGYVEEVEGLLAGRQVYLQPGENTPLVEIVAGIRQGKYGQRVNRMIEIFGKVKPLFFSLDAVERAAQHNDTKINNFVFAVDPETKEPLYAKCLIDLDTIQPGILVDDIGDAGRSILNSAGEEPWLEGKTLQDVTIDKDIAEYLVNGYLNGMLDYYTARYGQGGYQPPLARGMAQEKIEALRPFAYKAIALYFFELGTRFLKDFISERARPLDADLPQDSEMKAGGEFIGYDMAVERHGPYFKLTKDEYINMPDKNLRLAEVQYAAGLAFLRAFQGEVGLNPSDIQEPTGWQAAAASAKAAGSNAYTASELDQFSKIQFLPRFVAGEPNFSTRLALSLLSNDAETAEAADNFLKSLEGTQFLMVALRIRGAALNSAYQQSQFRRTVKFEQGDLGHIFYVDSESTDRSALAAALLASRIDGFPVVFVVKNDIDLRKLNMANIDPGNAFSTDGGTEIDKVKESAVKRLKEINPSITRVNYYCNTDRILLRNVGGLTFTELSIPAITDRQQLFDILTRQMGIARFGADIQDNGWKAYVMALALAEAV